MNHHTHTTHVRPEPIPLTLPRSAGLIAKQSPIAGIGCFAAHAFKKGDIVGRYTGEVITEAESLVRYGEREMTYLFDIGDGMYIDGDTHDSPEKYMNHSCEGNCESDSEGEKVWITALRDIAAGEEITYDYNLVVEADDEDPYHCVCRARTCRGTMKAPESLDDSEPGSAASSATDEEDS